jgi:uncharacterized membrane protein YccC
MVVVVMMVMVVGVGGGDGTAAMLRVTNRVAGSAVSIVFPKAR